MCEAHAIIGTCHICQSLYSIGTCHLSAHAPLTAMFGCLCLCVLSYLTSKAFAWSSDAINHAKSVFGTLPFVRSRELTMSSSYSGIATVEQAAHTVCTNLSSCADCGHHSVRPLWVLEKDETCKAEMQSWFASMGHPDACVFGNLKELIGKDWWPDLGFGPDSSELPPTELFAKGLHNATINTAAKACAVHAKRGCVVCTLTHSDIHVAGTTCVDHSNYGTCSGDEGKHVKFFLIWAALMKQLRPYLILHENVAGFGTAALFEVLGTLYIICPSVSCSSKMGYPIRRKRQMTILVLKAWIYPQLRDAGMGNACNPACVQRLVDMQATLDTLSQRPCHLSWKQFTVDSTEALNEEVAQGARRPGVVQRWASINAGHTHGTDKCGKACRLFAADACNPVLSALLPMERERIEQIIGHTNPSVDVIDVSQNPTQRSRTIKSTDSCFMTVIAGCGYLVRTDQMRDDPRHTSLVTSLDILSMSGFPVTDAQVAMAGAPCMFSTSRASSAPPARSGRSMRKQVGNAMHFAHIGLVFLTALVKFPSLGRDPPAQSSRRRSLLADASSTRVPSSSLTDSAFLRAVRARRAQ